MAKRRKRDRHPAKTRADQEGTDIHSQTSSSRQEKWISISGGWISLIAVHRPLSGPGVNIAGWCQDANTDQSRGDGSWWALMGPDGLPICQSCDGCFADTIAVNSITVTLCFYPEALSLLAHVCNAPFLAVHDWQDMMALCSVFCIVA